MVELIEEQMVDGIIDARVPGSTTSRIAKISKMTTNKGLKIAQRCLRAGVSAAASTRRMTASTL